MLQLVLLLIALPALAQEPIRGFFPENFKDQHELEERAKAIPQPARLHIYMERMASKPHHAGSPGSKAVADYLAAQLKEWSLDVHTENFEALMPYPTARSLEMTAPVHYRAELKEPVLPDDPASGQPDQLPTFNAYSASGDITAPLVYVNYGAPEDYDELKKLGVEVKGKIVIARYGRNWRGVKVKLAQRNGAVGCLIYSDPRDDGYFQNDVYPKGPMRPEQGVQRGSVLDMALYPGDPLSPGWASVSGSKRLPVSDAKSLPKIPVLPISYGDAKPLLAELGGPLVPEPWRGALPLTYHAGPGPATVHLKIDSDWSTRPLHDVIAKIPGSVYPDQWIVYGNHHDAWVNGASDPASAAAALLETARALSVLRQQGWQPKRTIVLALWDGEEFGLMGSTEWAEKHLDELRNNAVAYINSDLNGPGRLSASGSHTLETFVSEVLRDIVEPKSAMSLLEASKVIRNRARADLPPEFHLTPLGSGSDYVPFLDHIGIASLNFGFGSADSGGVYHSIYDSLAWFDKFSDTDLSYGRALSQITITSILRLSDASVLPYDFSALARTISGYVEEIERGARRRSGVVDLRPLQSQLNRLESAARIYNEALSKAPAASEDRIRKLNDVLLHAERTLLLPNGLPGRDWYKHALYAPGINTGYDAKTLPGVREAIEAQRWEEANQQARRLAQALGTLAAQVEQAAHLLN
ncbi:MAG: M28 family peptidase [Bryobacterales bacterium]|nr:M28 family peptidase [Bryobacterales bacterium]MBV9398474.1 M28 family peptidase [Bryobacterales bacterium]